MGCNKCGSNEINGNSSCTTTCGCSSSTPTCGSTCIPGTPAPYNAPCVSTCPQDHTQNVIINNFQGAVRIANAWNVPACGETSIVVINGLTTITIGSYLWNPNYGYFQVVAFNPTNFQVTLQNDCTSGNVPEGTQVPACSDFTITDGPAASSGGGGNPTLYPYVAIDFTAPANGSCIDITVTNTNGLAVGKNIQIGSGTYLLAGISSSTIINICNEGQGIAPGTAVIAQNAQGNYQYPVILIDVNPCTNDTILSGAIIACDGSLASPLTGATVGMIPVLKNVTTGEAEYQIINIPTATCTVLTADLTLVNGLATYTLIVNSSADFTNGDIIQIGTRTDRLTITNIPDGTTIQGTLVPTPGANAVIPSGTSVCIVNCCELLQNQVDDINDELECFPAMVGFPIALDVFAATLPYDSQNYHEQSFGDIFTFTNTLGCTVAVQTFTHVASYFTTNLTGEPIVVGTDVLDYAVFHELRTKFSNETGPYTFGRLGWVDHQGSTEFTPPYPTGAGFTEAVWTQLLPSAPSSVNYHEGVIVNITTVAPGGVVNLGFSYTGIATDIQFPALGANILIQVSGYANVFKV